MWLLPSLNRPAHLRRFFEAWKKTEASTPGILLIDKQDYEANREAYDALTLPSAWMMRVTRGRSQGDKIREIWPSIKHCVWFGLIGDDNIPETSGWDERLVSQLDGWNIVSCDDGWQAPKRLANCWVMGGPLVRAAGAIFPGGMQHLFVDDVWELIGREADCWECLMDVRVRHAHVLKGDALADETHRAVYGEKPGREGPIWSGDEAEFARWKSDEAPALIARVKEERKRAGLGRHSAQPNPGAAHTKRMQRALSRSVFIATPIARHPVRQYTTSLHLTLVLLSGLGIRAWIQNVVGASNLPRARNDLVAAFLASDYDDLLFIDDDMGWNPNDVLRILASEQQVIGGVGCKKVLLADTAPDKWCVRSFPGGRITQDEFGAIEVAAVGTGFLKISREVFEAMKSAHPDWKRKGWPDKPENEKPHYYRFFSFDPNDPDETGEDIAFCNEWRRLGGRVFVDPTIRLVHVGEMEFTGDFTALLQPAAAQQRHLEAAE